MSKYQLTFALIKPHAVKNPHTLTNTKRIICEQFQIIEQINVKLTSKLAEQFYGEHRNKFFYNRLHTSMCSGSVEALILCGENAIIRWRELMGPTKVYKTIYSHPNTIRGQFGLSDTRNICHGSDSMESAKREIELFFPHFSIEKWYRNFNKNNKIENCYQMK